MNETISEGAVEIEMGEAERLAGAAAASSAPKTRGAGRRIEGQIKQTADQLEDLIGHSAETASAAVARLSDRVACTAGSITDQAKIAYDKASTRARQTADVVEPFVQERPYTALGIAAIGGLVMGILLAGRGPKIIYVRPRA